MAMPSATSFPLELSVTAISVAGRTFALIPNQNQLSVGSLVANATCPSYVPRVLVSNRTVKVAVSCAATSAGNSPTRDKFGNSRNDGGSRTKV